MARCQSKACKHRHIRGAAGQEELAWSEPCSSQTQPAPRTPDTPARDRDVAAAPLQQQLQMAVSPAAGHLQHLLPYIIYSVPSAVSSAARRSHSSEMKPPRASITAARGQRGSSTQSCPPALFLGCSCSSRCPPSPSPGPVHLAGPPQPSPCPCGSGESSSLGCARPPGRICFLAFSFQDYGGDLYTCL